MNAFGLLILIAFSLSEKGMVAILVGNISTILTNIEFKLSDSLLVILTKFVLGVRLKFRPVTEAKRRPSSDLSPTFN